MSLLSCVVSDFSYAQTCTAAPSCEEMGYTQSASDCTGKISLRCPFDTSKLSCVEISNGSSSVQGINELNWKEKILLKNTASHLGETVKYVLFRDGCFFGHYTTTFTQNWSSGNSTTYYYYINVDGEDLVDLWLYHNLVTDGEFANICFKKGQYVIFNDVDKLIFVPGYLKDGEKDCDTTTYPLTSCPANGSCSTYVCGERTLYKLTSCNSGYTVYGNICSNNCTGYTLSDEDLDRIYASIDAGRIECEFDSCYNAKAGVTKYKADCVSTE